MVGSEVRCQLPVYLCAQVSLTWRTVEKLTGKLLVNTFLIQENLVVLVENQGKCS